MKALSSLRIHPFSFIPSLIAFLLLTGSCEPPQETTTKPRIIVSTDIGGTDPDDFQSMIHLLMYSDRFQIEGLIASPFGNGRKEDFLKMINLYEKDLPQLQNHSANMMSVSSLKAICKQGQINEAPYKGYSSATEGSEWIIHCASKPSDQPLWILVWGGIEDLAQALHDAPQIKENIRVYWIGGPNKKFGVNAYSYIAQNHPDLWMIEANATYRGWFMDGESPENLKGGAYYSNYIQGHGAMGQDFKKYYDGKVKMGDTPSLAYLMSGNPNDPSGDSWGGSFVPIARSSRYLFNRTTTVEDTVVAYAILEWHFDGPEINISEDSVCFTMTISNQTWPGHYLGDGHYGIRYSSKKMEVGTYYTRSAIPALDGLSGQYVSIAPWPGKPTSNDFELGSNWYSDKPEPEWFLGTQQGAKTISKHREAFLLDWAERWAWLNVD